MNAATIGAPMAALCRVRTGVRAALALGVAASVTANVLHAQPTFVGRAIAAWPPLALLLTIELISRVPVHGRWLSRLRIATTAVVAGIAAWVSYWHMVSVAARYGEQATSAHLIPLSVDGLVIVASVCLVEIGATIRASEARGQEAAVRPSEPVTADDGPGDAAAGPAATGSPTDAAERTSTRRPRGVSPAGRSGRRSVTAAKVARLRVQHPQWTAGEIAARVGVSERTVRRHLAAPGTPTASTPDNAADDATKAAA